jgi:UDP-perosamine 4-acetyltransferase
MDVAIIGAGGHGRVVLDIIRAGKKYTAIGFLDADSSLAGKRVGGIPVLGAVNLLPRLRLQQKIRAAVVAIGDSRIRRSYAKLVEEAGLELLTVIHPSASVSPTASIGRNVVIAAGACVSADAKVADSVIVNTNAVVDHECEVGAGAHICPARCLAGACASAPGRSSDWERRSSSASPSAKKRRSAREPWSCRTFLRARPRLAFPRGSSSRKLAPRDEHIQRPCYCEFQIRNRAGYPCWSRMLPPLLGLCAVSFVICWLLTFAMIRLAPRLGLIDKPGGRKNPRKPETPRWRRRDLLGVTLPLIAGVVVVNVADVSLVSRFIHHPDLVALLTGAQAQTSSHSECSARCSSCTRWVARRSQSAGAVR